MASILALVTGQPRRELAADSGVPPYVVFHELYVLEKGRLVVERDGVEIATIIEPGALIGEMSVLLGVDHSATVRATGPTVVRVIADGIPFLERTPLMALHVATLACARLDRTSAVLVELRKETEGKASEQGLLSRIFSTGKESNVKTEQYRVQVRPGAQDGNTQVNILNKDGASESTVNSATNWTTRSVRPLPCPKFTLISCADAVAVNPARIPATPTATVTRRTRRSEAPVTIFLEDGPASWPSPLRDSRTGSCRASPAARCESRV